MRRHFRKSVSTGATRAVQIGHIWGCGRHFWRISGLDSALPRLWRLSLRKSQAVRTLLCCLCGRPGRPGGPRAGLGSSSNPGRESSPRGLQVSGESEAVRAACSQGQFLEGSGRSQSHCPYWRLRPAVAGGACGPRFWGHLGGGGLRVAATALQPCCCCHAYAAAAVWPGEARPSWGPTSFP